MNDKRTFYRVRPDNRWEKVNILDIKKGDKIRAYEPKMIDELVIIDGKYEFIAAEDGKISQFGPGVLVDTISK